MRIKRWTHGAEEIYSFAFTSHLIQRHKEGERERAVIISFRLSRRTLTLSPLRREKSKQGIEVMNSN